MRGLGLPGLEFGLSASALRVWGSGFEADIYNLIISLRKIQTDLFFMIPRPENTGNVGTASV